MNKRRAILWFRQDLRLHDNEALVDCVEVAHSMLPVFVFDERLFQGYGNHGFRRIGRQRAQFIIESIHDLRSRLRRKGSNLIVRVGKPEEEIFRLAREFKSSWVFCNRERTPDEVMVQDRLEENLWSVGQEIRYSRGKMLYYTQDLPFPITQVPDHFSTFRKEVDKVISVRRPLAVPDIFPGFPHSVEAGNIPSLADFGWEDVPSRVSHLPKKLGGETSAIATVERWTHCGMTSQASPYLIDNRNLHISAHLAQGTLSPKWLYWKIVDAGLHMEGRGEKLLFELAVRDFLRLLVKKHGDKVFKDGGLRGQGDEKLVKDLKALQQWIAADTSDPYVNAFMTQLHHMAYLPQIGRLATSCYLVHHLGVHWQLGAEYFESTLIDYDPCSNWANWNIIAGVGVEPKDFSQYNIQYQASKLDPDGHYLRHWNYIKDLEPISVPERKA